MKGQPGIMKFKVAPEKEALLKISTVFPPKYPVHSIPHAEIEFVEGDFGSYSTQIIKTDSWAIGWLRFSIKKEVILYPTTDNAMVALYCTLTGSIPCKLEGVGPLVLENKKYSFYYIPPLIHNEATFVPGEYEAVYISFGDDFLAECAEEDLIRLKDLYNRKVKEMQSGEVFPPFNITNRELENFDMIRYHKLSGTKMKLHLASRINDLLVNYFSILETGKDTAQDEKNTAVHTVARYIALHLGGNLTNPMLETVAGINVNTLEKEFKKVFLVPLQQYVEDARMEEAKRQLVQTHLPIADISRNVGYSDSNYFSTVFRKKYGMSPTHYRNTHK
ncbi:AraC-type DNA-binding protein [Chitinophaga sp. YR573]|nr:AraC-type DNA-binding protein [Chitinophaga sp. YR573]